VVSIDTGITLGSKEFYYKLESNSKRIVLFGPSGSGKSTLLKLIAGFFDPSSGRININGTEYFNSTVGVNIPLNRRGIGYLPQEYTLFPHITVEKNITYGGQFMDKEKGKSVFSVEELAQRLGIGDRLHLMPGTLSGGEQQRAALARALYVNPSLLLLDEPFSSLDSNTRSRLRDLVIDITSDMNITTIFVTHDPEEAFIMGDHMVVIDQGKIREEGPVETVFTRPKFIETARRLGFYNEFNIKSITETHCETTDGHTFEHTCENYHGSFVVMKPDDVMILRDDTNAKDFRENVIKSVVEDIKQRTRITDVRVNCQGMPLYISLGHHAAERLKLQVGKEVHVSLKKESLVVCGHYQ
jgi:molybdate transport system ATP-binding protein